MNAYTISAFKHSSTLYKGIQSFTFNQSLEQIVNSGSGGVDPTFVGVSKIQPEASFTSTAIKTILGSLGIGGVAMSSDKFWFQKMAADGLRGGASVHIQATLANGIVIPTQIRAPHAAAATIGFRAVPRSADGTASPIALINNGSLETAQSSDAELYTMGAVTLNGVALPGVDEWTLDLGINLWVNSSDGKVYITDVGVLSRNPVFTARTFDMDTYYSWLDNGVAQGETDSTFVLSDQALGGVRGSSPITFTIDAGMAHFEDITGRHGERLGGSVKVLPVWDGTNDIIALSGLT
jgi:hypothetical protein